MTKKMIVKSNYLIEASYRLTLNEQRLILCAVSKIKRNDIQTPEITITAKEFAQMFPDIGETNAHTELINASNKLWEKDIKVSDPTQTKEFRWIHTKITHHVGEGRITLYFSPEIQKYLCQLKMHFTRYPVKEISSLKSVYSIRIYELIKQFEKLGQRKITLGDFKDHIGAEKKYSEFKYLKKQLLTPAIAELNKKSPLTISVDLIRERRRVVALSFNWQEKLTKKPRRKNDPKEGQ